ncbi:MAG: hypothetical protein ACYS6K_17805 [Planctomycetota bacterium]
MAEEISGNSGHQEDVMLQEYSPAQELFHNIPYIAMTVLGAVVLARLLTVLYGELQPRLLIYYTVWQGHCGL